ncbi:undecaprenyl diphosphate synthase family protein [Psychrobacillus sp. INOP01]|nr:undecaprenyl diphosphate synthase family protein [Psychrobacillus sp. INOP01]
MVQSVKQIVNKVQQEINSPDDSYDELIIDHLMTTELTESDLLIRTSGKCN